MDLNSLFRNGSSEDGLVTILDTSEPESNRSGDAFSGLYPAIVQCFTIVLLGYITGRAGWVTTSQTKGLNFFTTKVALPALLFSSMATLDWSAVSVCTLHFSLNFSVLHDCRSIFSLVFFSGVPLG
jgi:predicted permease